MVPLEHGKVSCYLVTSNILPVFVGALNFLNDVALCLLFGNIGGREKAPAAFCRKALTSTGRFEMWGDGLQTRSFTFIDECVEGVLR